MNRAARMTLIVFYIMLVLAICSVFAQSAPYTPHLGDKAVYGAGMISCAEWQKYRVSNIAPARYEAEAWIDGFLSGYNIGSHDDDVDFLADKPKSIALYAWIDNYCGSRPLDQLIWAAMSLRKELSSRMKR